MVFYRKYRPQKIDELDSQQVRDRLFSVLKSNVPHAFLFTGPKGLGKTSTARIVAKAVNCEVRGMWHTSNELPATSQNEPCNQCEQCVSITAGTNMDVIEIDAASNRGIDEIRDLREKIWLAPLKASKKVYIIDEVHMLTTEAFNALLKILEEPPEHAMFILCTTEPQKVPATILSRCFHISFNKATENELVRSLKRIVAGEKIEIDPKEEKDILSEIAKMADGGFRDAAKILEEFSLLAQGNVLNKSLIESTFKTATFATYVTSLLINLEKRKVKDSLGIIKNLTDQGLDIKYFISCLLESLHEYLLEITGVNEKRGEMVYSFSLEELKILTELFSKAHSDMKFAVLPQLPLELAIIEFIESDKYHAEVKGNTDSSDHKEKGIEEVTISVLRKQVGTKLKMNAIYGDKKDDDASAVKAKTAKAEIELMNVPANGSVTKEWMTALRNGLIDEMKQFNHTVAGVLRSCEIHSYDKKRLVIGAAYEFHKERLDDKKARAALRQACKVLTGNDVEIEVELKK